MSRCRTLRPRDGVKNPEALAGAYVETADVALHVGFAARNAARTMCRTDDDDVLGDHEGVACSPISPVTRSIS